VGVLVYPFRLVGVEVGVAVTVRVEVGVFPPEPIGLDGMDPLHPTIKAAGSIAIMRK
jgi:hypothetical protein